MVQLVLDQLRSFADKVYTVPNSARKCAVDAGRLSSFSCFLRLPLEIRIIVYDFCVGCNSPVPLVGMGRGSTQLNGFQTPNICQASQQLRKESYARFMSVNTFVFNHSDLAAPIHVGRVDMKLLTCPSIRALRHVEIDLSPGLQPSVTRLSAKLNNDHSQSVIVYEYVGPLVEDTKFTENEQFLELQIEHARLRKRGGLNGYDLFVLAGKARRLSWEYAHNPSDMSGSLVKHRREIKIVNPQMDPGGIGQQPKPMEELIEEYRQTLVHYYRLDSAAPVRRPSWGPRIDFLVDLVLRLVMLQVQRKGWELLKGYMGNWREILRGN